jgi:poly(A) polymerase Pap1
VTEGKFFPCLLVCLNPAILDISSFVRHFGVTPPISSSESNEREKEATNTLINELRGQYLNEDAEETRKR